MGENSIGKTAIGKVTSFNPITKDGLIVVKNKRKRSNSRSSKQERPSNFYIVGK